MNHHPFGPSSFGRIARCPGSYRLSKGLPPSSADDSATRGTLLHKLMTPGEHPEEKELNDFDSSQLQRARDWMDGIFRTFDEPMPMVTYEARLALPSLEGVPEELLPWGTADVIIVHPQTFKAVIIDHKTGPLEIDEDLAGSQVFLYALMFLESHPRTQGIMVKIYHWASGTEFSRIVTRNEIPAMRAHVRKTILEAMDSEAPLQPSATGCAYCPALRICPAARAVAMSRWDAVGDISRYTPDVLGHLMDRVKIAEAVLEALHGAIRDRAIKEPGAVAGYKILTTQNRELAEPYRVMHALPELTQSEFLSACRTSITALEKVYGDVMKRNVGGTKKAHLADLAIKLQRLGLIALGDEKHSLRRTNTPQQITDTPNERIA